MSSLLKEDECYDYYMKLDQEIFNVLLAAGAKEPDLLIYMKVEKIARHVYNSCNSIFTPLNYKDVHSYVTQYLTRCAKDPQSLIEKGKGYGVYHVNFDSKAVQQLMLNFSSSVLENSNEGEDKADDSAPQSLFDENMF